MTIDTTKLRELAQKATQGPWTAISDPMHFYSITTICAGKVDGTKPIPAQMMVQIGGNDECAQLEANTRFIAAANPAVALALLDEIDRLQSLASQAASVEREACAKVCEELAHRQRDYMLFEDADGCDLCAEEIRARGEIGKAMP